ncbi:MAG: MlaD family protein [Kiritimatiellales bacterium]
MPKNRTLNIEVLVGFFVFLTLIVLGIFTIVLSRKNFFKEYYPLAVHFEEIGGLRPGDNVFLRGTKVGVVKTTDLTHGGVFVHADLDVAVQLRTGYRIEITDSSLLGGKQMKIYEGPLTAGPIPADAGVYGITPVNVFDDLGIAVAEIKDMIKDVSAGEGTLGKLMKDDQVYNNLNAITEDLRQVSERLAAGKGTIGKLLSEDETLYADLQTTMGNVREITDKLKSGEGTLGKLIQDEEVYVNIHSMLANFSKISDDLANGEGTLGKLMTDDSIYIEAQQLLAELRAAIDDMRETSPVTTFSTILFGAF